MHKEHEARNFEESPWAHDIGWVDQSSGSDESTSNSFTVPATFTGESSP